MKSTEASHASYSSPQLLYCAFRKWDSFNFHTIPSLKILTYITYGHRSQSFSAFRFERSYHPNGADKFLDACSVRVWMSFGICCSKCCDRC